MPHTLSHPNHKDTGSSGRITLAGLRKAQEEAIEILPPTKGVPQAHLDGHSGVGTAAFDEDSKAVVLEGQCSTLLYHAHFSAENVQNSQGVASIPRDLKGATP